MKESKLELEQIYRIGYNNNNKKTRKEKNINHNDISIQQYNIKKSSILLTQSEFKQKVNKQIEKKTRIE